MKDYFKELNIIDILGIGVPGCLLLLLLGGDQTAELLWMDQFDNHPLAFGIVLIIVGSLAGMLIQELGDMIEKGLWLIPCLDPKVYAAYIVNTDDLNEEQMKDLEDHATAIPEDDAAKAMSIVSLLATGAVILCAAVLFPWAMVHAALPAQPEARSSLLPILGLSPLVLTAIAVLSAFIVISVVIFATVGSRLVRFVSDSEAFRAWIDERGFVGKLAYIGIVFLQIVVAIIPGEPIELVAGYAFGAWQGLLLAEIGILLSSAAIFVAVKKWGTRAVEAFIPREKFESLSFLQNDTRRNAIVFLIFFIPGTPKDVITYFVGLTPMTLRDWLLITTIARIPSVISSTLTGAAVGESNFLAAGIIYGITALFSLAGALVYRKFMAKKDEK